MSRMWMKNLHVGFKVQFSVDKFFKRINARAVSLFSFDHTVGDFLNYSTIFAKP